MEQTEMSRRGFIVGGASAAAMAAAALAGLSADNGNIGKAYASESESGSASQSASKAASGSASGSASSAASAVGSWDAEADVVVCGFGFAGASAALGAAGEGSSVIILEKAPEGDEGGNSSVCCGGFVTPNMDDQKDAFEFIRYQCPDIISDDEINAFIEEISTTTEWLDNIEVSYSTFERTGMLYAALPTSAGFTTVGMGTGAGNGLYKNIEAVVQANKDITVMFETPATKLIFDPDTKEVFGVIATDADGNVLRIKAARGVVMALGGFENNHQMLTTYYAPNFPIVQCGTPYNTGDGIEMVKEVGAELRGFSSAEWACHGCRPASEEIGCLIGFNFFSTDCWSGAIMVNDQGKRFVNEASTTVSTSETSLRPLHDKSQLPELIFNMETLRYTNLPMYIVFDSTKVAAGPVFNSAASSAAEYWAHMHNWYTWSDDNQTEIEKGWITEADTLDELAQKLGIDPEGLQAEVDAWNASVDAGSDDEFGRTAALGKIETGPFYGCELCMGLINTQGGASRDGQHHVLDPKGNAIPRLYSAGELGSMYVWLYQGAGNVPEALAGRYAGQYVAQEEPWA